MTPSNLIHAKYAAIGAGLGFIEGVVEGTFKPSTSIFNMGTHAGSAAIGYSESLADAAISTTGTILGRQVGLLAASGMKMAADGTKNCCVKTARNVGAWTRNTFCTRPANWAKHTFWTRPTTWAKDTFWTRPIEAAKARIRANTVFQFGVKVVSTVRDPLGLDTVLTDIRLD